MSSPSHMLENLILSDKIRHAGHPVLAWNAANVTAPPDHHGNIKPSKSLSTERIDGIVSLIMALGVQSSVPATVEQNWDIQVI